jgi:hypothetical protein
LALLPLAEGLFYFPSGIKRSDKWSTQLWAFFHKVSLQKQCLFEFLGISWFFTDIGCKNRHFQKICGIIAISVVFFVFLSRAFILGLFLVSQPQC